MKWVTREHIKVDRVACPWLIKKFIDPQAEFIFVPADKIAVTEGIPFDAAGVELGHHSGKCSFEVIIEKYNLSDPALVALAKIVHAADVSTDRDSAPEGPGLKAIAQGFALICNDDHEILEKEFIVYDALYAYCQNKIKEEKS
ncbi:MAG: chromate resistance protein [bacterium]|nr:chromate resistance protein [bacterium]